uniref:hypothetical chloroplast RF47 n=1 Tax=Phyllosiphon coccidium TaxID=1837062 RepID=UPI0024114701|nr:hypothetical chloroplast RF47 [Phyllosiphon coccidium]WDY12720.1 hypothetical chloroplast RF47 [Phyllosiphon coccidium]
MLGLISRFIIASMLIIFVTPQTSIIYYNYVVLAIHSTGILLNYAQVRKFVFRFTWLCVFLFLFSNMLTVF